MASKAKFDDKSKARKQGGTSLDALRAMPEPDILKYIQETQAPITLRDSEGRTLVHLACELNDHAALDKMLKDGNVDVNIKSSCNRTPLHYAALWGSTDCVRLLITSKMRLDYTSSDSTNCTPLDLAASCGHSCVMNLLICMCHDDSDGDDE